MAHGRWAKVLGTATGIVTYALTGFSADNLTEFEGPVTLFLSVEGSGRPTGPVPPIMPGGDPAQHFPGNAVKVQGLAQPPLRAAR